MSGALAQPEAESLEVVLEQSVPACVVNAAPKLFYLLWLWSGRGGCGHLAAGRALGGQWALALEGRSESFMAFQNT